MELLVRTWNVFHGNTDPPRARGQLRQMVELATADRPDVLCLQELPLWSLQRLEAWAGMRACSVATLPALLPRRLAGWVTRRHQGLLRSAIAGQANAILVAPQHELTVLDDHWLSAPGHHPRRAHAARVAAALVVINAHISAHHDELDRLYAFAERWQPVVLAGDLNLRDVARPGWSAPAAGIDHVLARGLSSSAPTIWAVQRRTVAGLVLSDHAPVEARVSLPAQ